MVIATRLLNLVSGVLLLVTGLYVEIALDHIWSDSIRWLIVSATTVYFIVQFCLQVIRPVYAGETVVERPGGRQFSS